MLKIYLKCKKKTLRYADGMNFLPTNKPILASLTKCYTLTNFFYTVQRISRTMITIVSLNTHLRLN